MVDVTYTEQKYKHNMQQLNILLSYSSYKEISQFKSIN